MTPDAMSSRSAAATCRYGARESSGSSVGMPLTLPPISSVEWHYSVDRVNSVTYRRGFAYEQGDRMDSRWDPAALAECVALLDEEGRRAVRQYWEQVIREEWVSPA